MDPLSITSGCVALIAGVGNATINVSAFIRSCRDARSDLMTIHGELNELRLVLQLLEDDASTITVIPEGLQAQVLAVITKCSEVVADVDALIYEQIEQRRGGMRWAWSGKDKVVVLRQSLENHRGALMLAVETVQLCLAKDIKIDTAAIRQETSEIPEVKRTTEEILEEIQRLRLEISERGAMEGDPMLERYLDSLTTYAGTIVSGDVEDFQERFELLRPLSPIPQLEDVHGLEPSTSMPRPSGYRMPSDAPVTQNGDTSYVKDRTEKVQSPPDRRLHAREAVSLPPMNSREDTNRESSQAAEIGRSILIDVPPPIPGGASIQSLLSLSVSPEHVRALLALPKPRILRTSSHVAKNGTAGFFGFGHSSDYSKQYYAMLSSSRQTVRIISLNSGSVEAKVKYRGKSKTPITVSHAQLAGRFLFVEWATGDFERWEIRSGAWSCAAYDKTLPTADFLHPVVAWAAYSRGSWAVVFFLCLSPPAPGSESRTRQVFAVDSRLNQTIGSFTLPETDGTAHEVRLSPGQRWLEIIDTERRRLDVLEWAEMRSWETELRITSLGTFSFLPDMQHDNWVLWIPDKTLTVIDKEKLEITRWNLRDAAKCERTSLDFWREDGSDPCCRLAPNGRYFALWDANERRPPELRDSMTGAELARYEYQTNRGAQTERGAQDIQFSPYTNHHVQILDSFESWVWSVEFT